MKMFDMVQAEKMFSNIWNPYDLLRIRYLRTFKTSLSNQAGKSIDNFEPKSKLSF